jgi:hypothetical protein
MSLQVPIRRWLADWHFVSQRDMEEVHVEAGSDG